LYKKTALTLSKIYDLEQSAKNSILVLKLMNVRTFEAWLSRKKKQSTEAIVNASKVEEKCKFIP